MKREGGAGAGVRLLLLSLLLLVLGCPPAVQEVKTSQEKPKISPAKRHYDIGFQYLRSEMWDDAIVNCEKAIEESLTYVDAYLALAKAYDGKGEFGLEVQTYEKGITNMPEETRLRYGLGAVLVKLGRHEEAMAQYDKALEIKRGDSDALYGKGYVFEKKRGVGSLDSAIVYYEKAVRADPDNLPALFSLAKAYIATGRSAEALEYLLLIAEKHPGDLQVRMNLGDAYFDLTNYQQAEIHYRYVLSETPEYVPAIIKLGKTLEKEKRFTEALAQYDRASELEPKSALVCLQIANLCLEVKDISRGMRAALQALDLNPSLGAPHFYLGEFYLEKRDWDAAEREYREALRLDPATYKQVVANRLKIVKARRQKEKEEEEGW